MIKNDCPQKLTDLTYLREIAYGRDAFIIQMLNIFMEEMPLDLARMEIAMKTKNWESLRKLAHKIKPSFLYTGMKETADAVPVLEEYATRKSHLDAIPGLVDKVKWACGRAYIELQDELKLLSR